MKERNWIQRLKEVLHFSHTHTHTHTHKHTGTMGVILPSSGQQSLHASGFSSKTHNDNSYKNSTIGTLHLFEVQRPLKNTVHHWGGKTFCKGEWQGSVASQSLILFFYSPVVMRTWPVPREWLGKQCKYTVVTTRHAMKAAACQASCTTPLTGAGTRGSGSAFHNVPLCITCKNAVMLYAHNYIVCFGWV